MCSIIQASGPMLPTANADGRAHRFLDRLEAGNRKGGPTDHPPGKNHLPRRHLSRTACRAVNSILVFCDCIDGLIRCVHPRQRVVGTPIAGGAVGGSQCLQIDPVNIQNILWVPIDVTDCLSRARADGISPNSQSIAPGPQSSYKEGLSM